jgi:hypothetical protein
MTKLLCPECRHENEPERIYCHSCGARLDRTAAGLRKDDIHETRRRVKKLFDPQGAKFRFLFFNVSKLILGACALAAVVQLILPPDVPPPIKTAMLASQISFDLENVTSRHQPPQVQYTEEEVNSYLTYALRPKPASLNKPLRFFKRTVVGFGEGSCNVTVERSLFGFPLYTSCIYGVTITEGKIVVANKGGSIGRLSIHPQLTQFMDVLFSDVWSALDREKRLIVKLGAIVFHDKSVVLSAP